MLRMIALICGGLLATACAGNDPSSKAMNTHYGYTLAMSQTVESHTDGNGSRFEAKQGVAQGFGKNAAKMAAKKGSFETASAGNVSDAELDKNRGTFSPETLNSSVLEANSSENITIGGVTPRLLRFHGDGSRDLSFAPVTTAS